MEPLVAILAGVLFGTSVYLLLARNLVRFLFGLVLLSNAANLSIFAAGRLPTDQPPLVSDGAETVQGTVANALPQALLLTAIVISFGLLAFALALVYRVYRETGHSFSEDMHYAEGDGEPGDTGAGETVSAPAPTERGPSLAGEGGGRPA